MLRLMLNAHPEVAVPPESRFIVELYAGTDDVDVSAWLDKLAAHRRFQAWELPIETVASEIGDAARVSYRAAAEAPFKAYAAARGKRRWGDKTPRYVESIAFLAELWPEARFIHMVRDGRDVALSYADLPFGPKTVAKAAELWAGRVARGMEAGRSLGAGRYLEIHYEDLVRDAAGLEHGAAEICRLLELELDPAMLDYTRHARQEVLTRASTFNRHVTSKPEAPTRAWEQEMEGAKAEVFEAVAGDVLAELGYPRRYPEPSMRARLVARLGLTGVPVGRL